MAHCLHSASATISNCSSQSTLLRIRLSATEFHTGRPMVPPSSPADRRPKASDLELSPLLSARGHIIFVELGKLHKVRSPAAPRRGAPPRSPRPKNRSYMS